MTNVQGSKLIFREFFVSGAFFLEHLSLFGKRSCMFWKVVFKGWLFWGTTQDWVEINVMYNSFTRMCLFYCVLIRISKITINMSSFLPRRTITFLIGFYYYTLPTKWGECIWRQKKVLLLQSWQDVFYNFIFMGSELTWSSMLLEFLWYHSSWRDFKQLSQQWEGSWKLDKIFGLYLHKTSSVTHYQSVAYLENYE